MASIPALLKIKQRAQFMQNTNAARQIAASYSSSNEYPSDYNNKYK